MSQKEDKSKANRKDETNMERCFNQFHILLTFFGDLDSKIRKVRKIGRNVRGSLKPLFGEVEGGRQKRPMTEEGEEAHNMEANREVRIRR